MNTQFLLFFYILTISFINGLKLPNYIKPCSLSDENLNECAKINGQLAIPELVKGDSKYKIASLTPLKVPEIKFDTGNLNIQLLNADISGFEDAKIKDVSFDIPNNHISLTLIIDKATLISDYVMDGHILILPLRGNGAANITFVGGEYTYMFDYILAEKRGENYLKIINHDLEYVTKRSYFQFDNLFEGDVTLGKQMNNFLKENWKDVEKEVGPAVTDTIKSIITSMLNAIFNKVPFSSIFLP